MAFLLGLSSGLLIDFSLTLTVNVKSVYVTGTTPSGDIHSNLDPGLASDLSRNFR